MITAINATADEINPTEYTAIRHNISHSRINPMPRLASPTYTIPSPATKKDNNNATVTLATISQPFLEMNIEITKYLKL